MTEMIPYGKQDISAADIQAVVDVLHSPYLTQGPAVPAFEAGVAAYCGAKHAVAVSSATSALHIACLALGVGEGDWVWTTPITFVASANCALYCGARVDFVDIDPRSYNISVPQLARKLQLAAQAGTLPKVLIPVHLCGQSCDMAAIHELAQHYGFRIIEDAAHAIGGVYRAEAVGSCRYSDITVFSFHPVKIITSGEGGMAVTSHAELARRMQRLRSHGITRAAEEMDREPDGPWYYQQIELGYNYRMTDMQAALGLSQMQRLQEFVAARSALAARYDRLLEKLPVVTPWRHADASSAWHLYVIRLQLAQCGKSRREVFELLRGANIGVNLHYIPLYAQPYFRRMGFSAADYPEAEKYYAEAITLPLFPGLTSAQQDRVVEVLQRALMP